MSHEPAPRPLGGEHGQKISRSYWLARAGMTVPWRANATPPLSATDCPASSDASSVFPLPSSVCAPLPGHPRARPTGLTLLLLAARTFIAPTAPMHLPVKHLRRPQMLSSMPSIPPQKAVGLPPQEECTTDYPHAFEILLPGPCGSAGEPVCADAKRRHGEALFTLRHGRLDNLAGFSLYLQSDYMFAQGTRDEHTPLSTSFAVCPDNSLAFDGSSVWYRCEGDEEFVGVWWHKPPSSSCTQVTLQVVPSSLAAPALEPRSAGQVHVLYKRSSGPGITLIWIPFAVVLAFVFVFWFAYRRWFRGWIHGPQTKPQRRPPQKSATEAQRQRRTPEEIVAQRACPQVPAPQLQFQQRSPPQPQRQQASNRTSEMRTQSATMGAHTATMRTQPATMRTQPATMRTQSATMQTQPVTMRTQPATDQILIDLTNTVRRARASEALTESTTNRFPEGNTRPFAQDHHRQSVVSEYLPAYEPRKEPEIEPPPPVYSRD